MSKKSNRFSPEVRERAVRMVQEHRGEYQSDCIEVAETITKLLVSWTFRNGGHENGWGTLESSLYCVAVLSLRPELKFFTSSAKLSVCMAEYSISQELLDRTARDIRTEAQSRFFDQHGFGIKHAMSCEDPEKLSTTLMEIANLLSPCTADEPIRSRHFG